MKTLLIFNLLQELPTATGWYETLTSGVVLAELINIGIKIFGAVLALLAGRWVIGYAVKAVDRTMRTQQASIRL